MKSMDEQIVMLDDHNNKLNKVSQLTHIVPSHWTFRLLKVWDKLLLSHEAIQIN